MCINSLLTLCKDLTEEGDKREEKIYILKEKRLFLKPLTHTDTHPPQQLVRNEDFANTHMQIQQLLKNTEICQQ